MSRISKVMSNLADQGKKALIPYVTGGDPRPGETVQVMHELVSAGADIIELGVPFSDPMADGPVIQLACERALAAGTTINDVLGMVSDFRKDNADTPVVLMGYLNPVEMRGYDTFVTQAHEAGVDGLLMVDLPPEEADKLVPLLKARDMDAIFLIAPTTTDDRIASICKHSSGYVYYVSVKGVTGSKALSVEEVSEKVSNIKSMSGDVPVGVGFGIRDAESAKAVASVSDGIIVGSVLVNTIAEYQDNMAEAKSRIAQLISEMRAAMDEGVPA